MKLHMKDKDIYPLSLADTLNAMKRQEEIAYDYMNFFNAHPKEKCDVNSELMLWREKICYWTYSVVDHFDLSRRTVAISLNIFDRFLANQGNTCDGSHALLVSLTSLYIAIKVHERKKIKLCTLVELSRSQFTPSDIENMELEILMSLKWLVHPPAPVDFVSIFVKFLPPSFSGPMRQNIYELSRYIAELSVCDPFLVGTKSSSIAFSAVSVVLEDEMGSDIAFRTCKDLFIKFQYNIYLHRDSQRIEITRERLKSILRSSSQHEPAVRGGRITSPKSIIPSFSEQVQTESLSKPKGVDAFHSSYATFATKDVQDSRHTKNCRSRCSSSDSRGSTAAKRLQSKPTGIAVTPS